MCANITAPLALSTSVECDDIVSYPPGDLRTERSHVCESTPQSWLHKSWLLVFLLPKSIIYPVICPCSMRKTEEMKQTLTSQGLCSPRLQFAFSVLLIKNTHRQTQVLFSYLKSWLLSVSGVSLPQWRDWRALAWATPLLHTLAQP